MIQQPFHYWYAGNFSNRKRVVDGFISLDADADFRAETISVQTRRMRPADILFSIYDEHGGPWVIGCSGAIADMFGGFPLATAVVMPAGKVVGIELKLRDGVNLGRTRPRFRIGLTGCKLFPEVPGSRLT